MERIGEGLGTLAAAEAPPAQLRERILEKVGDRPRAPRHFRFPWVESLVSAGIVAILGAIIFPVFSQARESARRSPRNAVQVNPETAYAPSEAQKRMAPGSPAASPMAGGSAAGSPAASSPVAGMGGQRAGQDRSVDDDINRYVRGSEGDVTSRKVVQTADFSITVHRVLEDAEKDFTKRIQRDGGYIESSVLNSGENGDRTAVLAVRVPVEKWEETLSWLTGFGDVTAKNVRGEDITGQWIDERAQVRELRAEEDRLAKKIDQTKSPAERSAARWELVQLRGHIRASEERFAATAKMAALATLNVSLTQTRKSAQGAGFLGDMSDTLGAALGGFMTAVRIPLAVLIWVLVFSPLWLPCVLIYRWVSRARAEMSR